MATGDHRQPNTVLRSARMAVEENRRLNDAIGLLWEVQQALYDGLDEMESLNDKWTEDGDEKHADAAIDRTVEMISLLLRARAACFEARHHLLSSESDVVTMLGAACHALESGLKDAMMNRQWMEANPDKIEELTSPNYPMELLHCAWWGVAEDDCQDLNMSLLILENTALREQLESGEGASQTYAMGHPAEPELTDTESNILEALGRDTLKGAILLQRAGYDHSSHYRQILSNLVKRHILCRSHQGYYNPRRGREDGPPPEPCQ
jgi:hypothetical protein